MAEVVPWFPIKIAVYFVYQLELSRREEMAKSGVHVEVSVKNGSRFALFVASLCVLAYLPAFNNGFISDDYVILGRLDSLRHDPFFLFNEPPECFRLTSYLCFGILRFIFGYHAAWYYGFNLLLHIANSLLVWKLASRLSGSAQSGMLAAVLFATVQGHLEAIMWLAAMNETLLGFFLLSCLVLWETRRTVHSLFPYVAALFSKESALMLIGLLPLFDRLSENREHQARRRISYCLIVLISIAFLALFFALVARNFMLNAGTYAFGFHAVPVFLLSMHRLLFPWVYLAVAILLAQRVRLKPVGSVLHGLGFAGVALAPYIFLTYQNHITSRQEYMASVGIAWSLAILVQGFKARSWRTAFVLAFVVVNIGYIWIKKDADFEQRAAPTNRLIEILRDTPPQDLYLTDFPGNSWIAKNTSRLVPGWKTEFIHVNETSPPTGGGMQFYWNPVASSYFRQVRSPSARAF
jgi:hypothetical protein